MNTIILWAARITGGLMLALMIGVMAGDIYEGKFVERFAKPDEAWKQGVMFGSAIIGLSIAYKWEGIGGAIVTVGLLVIGFFNLVVLLPGLLYVVYWFLTLEKKTQLEQ